MIIIIIIRNSWRDYQPVADNPYRLSKPLNSELAAPTPQLTSRRLIECSCASTGTPGTVFVAYIDHLADAYRLGLGVSAPSAPLPILASKREILLCRKTFLHPNP